MKITIDSKGRIILPKAVRDTMNIDESSELSINLFEDTLVIRKKHDLEEINKYIGKITEYINNIKEDENFKNELKDLLNLFSNNVNLTNKKED